MKFLKCVDVHENSKEINCICRYKRCLSTIDKLGVEKNVTQGKRLTNEDYLRHALQFWRYKDLEVTIEKYGLKSSVRNYMRVKDALFSIVIKYLDVLYTSSLSSC